MYLGLTALVLFYCTWVSYIGLVRRCNRNAPLAPVLASLAQLRICRCRESYEKTRIEVVLKQVREASNRKNLKKILSVVSR